MTVLPNRAHRAQGLNNIGDRLDDIINVLLGVLLAKGQAQRAVRDLVRQTDRHQNVRRIERTGRACRTGGAAYACVIQSQDQALALNRLKDERSGARQTVYRIAGIVGVRNVFHNALNQLVGQLLDVAHLLVQTFNGLLHRCCQTDEEAMEGLDEKMGYVKKLTDKLVKGIMENIPYSHYTGDPVNRLPGTASFVFEAIEGEGLILRLDNAGVCGSTGSACSTGSLDPSHVLMAIGLPHEIAHGSLRLTLGEQNTEEDVDYIIETVTDVVKTLRSMSPVWENGHPNLTAATELHAH